MTGRHWKDLRACLGAPLLVVLFAIGMSGHISAAEAPLNPPEPALLRIEFSENESALGQTARENIEAFSSDFARKSGRLELRAYAVPAPRHIVDGETACPPPRAFRSPRAHRPRHRRGENSGSRPWGDLG